MLAISPLRSIQDASTREAGTTTSMDTDFHDEFPDFSGVNLLESIDFDDLFMGMHSMDGLPDLEMDPELLAEFSISGEEDSTTMSADNNMVSPNSFFDGPCEDDLKLENCDTISCLISKDMLEENEIESKKKDSKPGSIATLTSSSSSSEKDRGNNKKHKSSLNTKGGTTTTATNNNNTSNQGKRKTKVDWTPELHRRFVQAVEQLGVDKAVPSRILELMGIDCLTRHNIASHLQKYRSHRKHLLAREAEAATWTQKRQMYGVAMGSTKNGANISPWPPHPPMIGFPPMTTTMHHPVRPFHVWGHPSMDSQARMPMWPKHVGPRTLSHIPQPWAPHPPPPDSAFWHSPHHRRLPIPVAPSPVPGIPPHAMYGREHGTLPPPTTQSSGPATPLDPQPSKESVDAALGDVLAKPWLPLPIGLKPPSMDSVFVELQRQGISKIPPSSSSS